MERDLRKKKLIEIQQIGNPYMTGIRIRYQGESRSFDAYVFR
jgi:hypothetical protein